ncbi:uncharacterized protein LOC121917160 [Sceloporus undulatus]|uniref:uncharacterized protein LOC121917160 n=1 Tax=Sceloporus undulatus TaxID=8520 RepID=UPI001C4DD469|nr:uncharacterized protein LOC121917160 [Sceloporus undulatus]
MESVAGTMLNKRRDSRKNGVTGLLTKHLRKALRLSSPVVLSQHCTGSCPNLQMSRNEALDQPISREAPSRAQSPMKTHQVLCLSLSSDGVRQDNNLVSPENLDAQMKQTHSGGIASSTGSLEQASLFCVSVSSSSSRSTLPKQREPLSKSKPFVRSSFLTPLLWNHSSELDNSLISISGSKKGYRGSLKSGVNYDVEAGVVPGFNFLEPLISRVTDCIYVGNLRAGYSGQALCKNNIDSIIDMSSLPRDCRLNFIPCTCCRGLQHSWSRLKVHIQGPLDKECHSLQQPCFRDINTCIDASLEKRKRILIHCRDGYSLSPTCVIQYLMVKHHMRLLAAYEFVRARYPVNIQECHRDLLVDLERSLWPGEIDMEGFKQAMARKMAWT